jgi:hypothetical protein
VVQLPPAVPTHSLHPLSIVCPSPILRGRPLISRTFPRLVGRGSRSSGEAWMLTARKGDVWPSDTFSTTLLGAGLASHAVRIPTNAVTSARRKLSAIVPQATQQ